MRLAIDDFGTGYSSLSYLQRYPIEILKLHRSFVSTLGDAGDDDSMTRAIVQLAQNLSMTTIAEGVERPAQVGALLALGCLYAQGFHFAKPLPEADFTALLEREAGRIRGFAAEAPRPGGASCDRGADHVIDARSAPGTFGRSPEVPYAASIARGRRSAATT